MEKPKVLQGALPVWTRSGYGSGDGYGSGSSSGYGDGDGYGYGSGSGDGYGDGDGDGDGSGDGSGDGYGYGYGSGSGYGYGYGSGSGSGDGYGYGYGYGDGYGYGYGYGAGDGYWFAVFESYLNTCPRVAELSEDSEVKLAFWWSNKDGKPSNGGSSKDEAKPGLIQKVQGPLELCTKRALHATVNPEKWKGDRLWIVALSGEVEQSEDKLGALEREIVCEVMLT